MIRCKHERETVKVLTAEAHFVQVYCTVCQQGWMGCPYPYTARRHHFTARPPRVQKPPRWVTRALSLDDESTDEYAAKVESHARGTPT